MKVLLVWSLLLVAVLGSLKVLLKRARFKGWFGEKLMSVLLRKLDPQRYRVLNGVYLPKPDGTTAQLDHIVVSECGVFVIETKTYRGWIFGDAKSKVWTQCVREKGFRRPVKNTFQNPMHQNYSHLCALEKCTGIPKDVMRPVIAFSGEATFKTERPDGVCYFGDVVKYIQSFRTPLIRTEQVDEIVDVILEWQATLTDGQKRLHVDNLKKRHGGVTGGDSVPKCPYCCASMVLRKRKSDGRPFYGCSDYPRCKGIVNIRG